MTRKGLPKIVNFEHGLAIGDTRRTPEYRLFESRPARDLYALGTLFYEVLTGEPPPEGEAPLLPSELNPEVPFGLEKVTMRLLQERPEHRYQVGEELVADLEALLSTGEDWERPFQTPAASHTASSTTAPASWRRGVPWRAIALGAGAVLALAAALALRLLLL